MTRTSSRVSAALNLLAVLLLGAGCASGARAPAAAPSEVPAASPAAPASRFANYDGNRVRYESVGSGREAIVLVHGWSGDAGVWRFQVPELAKSARVIALDLPGHGASDKPETAYSMDFFAGAVEAVMLDAGVDRAVLVGHSMGTPIIRRFHHHYPGKTLALVAVDGALQNLYSGMLDPLIAELRKPGYKDLAGKFIASMFTNPGTEALRDATLASTLATPQHVLVGSFEGMRDPAIWSDEPIGVPLLVVNAKSPYWTPSYVEYVRKLAPQVDYRVIEGTGHFVMLEKPQEFNAALLDFLQKQKLLGAGR
jgi:pimeloyl-ACP methyl ester carboxylesterase